MHKKVCDVCGQDERSDIIILIQKRIYLYGLCLSYLHVYMHVESQTIHVPYLEQTYQL